MYYFIIGLIIICIISWYGMFIKVSVGKSFIEFHTNPSGPVIKDIVRKLRGKD